MAIGESIIARQQRQQRQKQSGVTPKLIAQALDFENRDARATQPRAGVRYVGGQAIPYQAPAPQPDTLGRSIATGLNPQIQQAGRNIAPYLVGTRLKEQATQALTGGLSEPERQYQQAVERQHGPVRIEREGSFVEEAANFLGEAAVHPLAPVPVPFAGAAARGVGRGVAASARGASSVARGGAAGVRAAAPPVVRGAGAVRQAGASAADRVLAKVPTNAPVASSLQRRPSQIGGGARTTVEDLYGMEYVNPVLSRRDQAVNLLKTTTRLGTPARAEVTPLLRTRAGVRDKIVSTAKTAGAETDAIAKQAFRFDKQGRVTNLAKIPTAKLDTPLPRAPTGQRPPDYLLNAPTIQDIAARLPEFQPYLSAAQRRVLARIKEKMSPFNRITPEHNIPVESRTDIIPGGFYLPRGAPKKKTPGVQRIIKRALAGGPKSFEKPISFDSQAQGISAGYRYPTIGGAVEKYVGDTSRAGLDDVIARNLRLTGEEIQAAIGGVPQNAHTIPLYGVSDVEFPTEIANAARVILNKEKLDPGLKETVVTGVNQLMRGLNATADVSFMGIQGLLGAARDPIGYSMAMRVALEGFVDGGALGKYLIRYNENAAIKSVDWTRRGLRVGGEATEFQIGGNIAGSFGNLISEAPAVKQFNRMFGYFGDALRLELADTLYRVNTKRLGRELTEQEFSQIAQSANRMTGYSTKRFGGDFGDMVLFAPRFLQSELELVAALPKRGIEGRTARGAFTRLLGLGIGLTFAANAVQGKATVMDPTNPNFMRITDVGGADISVFGPWDSVLKAFLYIGQGDFNYIVRSRASPLVSKSIDLYTGSTFMGEDPRDAETFLRGLVPFSLQDIGSEPIISSALGQTGLKVTERSIGERTNALWENAFAALDPSQQEGVATVDEFFEKVGGRAAKQRLQAAMSPEDLGELEELESRRADRDEIAAVTGDVDAEVREVQRWVAEKIDAAATDAAGLAEFRGEYTRLVGFSQLFKEYKGTEFAPGESEVATDINRYFQAFELAEELAEGEEQFDLVDKLHAEMIEDLGEERWGRVLENIFAVPRLDAHPTVRRFQDLKFNMAKTGFWEIDKQLWKDLRDSQPGQVLSAQELSIVRNFDSYDAFYRGLEEWIIEGLMQTRGLSRQDAAFELPDEISRMRSRSGTTLNVFGEIRGRLRARWAGEHPDVAREAIEAEYIRNPNVDFETAIGIPQPPDRSAPRRTAPRPSGPPRR